MLAPAQNVLMRSENLFTLKTLIRHPFHLTFLLCHSFFAQNQVDANMNRITIPGLFACAADVLNARKH